MPLNAPNINGIETTLLTQLKAVSSGRRVPKKTSTEVIHLIRNLNFRQLVLLIISDPLKYLLLKIIYWIEK